MPIFLPRERGDALPWDAMHSWLLIQPDPEAVFKEKNRRTAGFIIAWWPEDDSSGFPDRYLKEVFPPSQRTSRKMAAWGKFNDTHASEDPRQFRNLKKILDVMDELRDFYGTDCIGVAYWVHPEADYKPLEGYQKMEEGSRFPGSPRR